MGRGDEAGRRVRVRIPTARRRAPARWWRRYTNLRVRGSLGLETNRRLARWALISPFIGLIAGLGAIALYSGIQVATTWFLGRGAGYLPPLPAGEGPTVVRPVLHPWLIVAMVVLGGLISGLLVFLLAPEAEGHGTDAAISAFHQARPIRPRAPLVKLVASAITIGSGGSGGREGPTAQISAGFASLLATLLKLDEHDRRTAIAAGMGAGIGAIFRAPLGGALMAAELPYRHDLEVEAIIPGLIASIVGYAVFAAWGGATPIFGIQASLSFDHPLQLLYYAVLGAVCGGVGLCYARVFAGVGALFRRAPGPSWLKPAVGGLLVGLLALAVPQVLGLGYGWTQVAMGPGLLALPLWVVLALPFAKILATSLSIGSGGSGGIFGPGMVIGGFTGAALWRLGHGVLPGMPVSPAPFVIVGMMAMFGGIAHAPIAVMLMVAEMTGNLLLLAPAMIAVAVCTVIVGDATIYTSQVNTRADSPAHRSRLLALPRRAATLLEEHVPRGSALVGRSLRELQLPGGSLVVAVRRDGDVVIPRGSTHLAADDVLTLAVQRSMERAVREALAALHAPPPASDETAAPVSSAERAGD